MFFSPIGVLECIFLMPLIAAISAKFGWKPKPVDSETVLKVFAVPLVGFLTAGIILIADFVEEPSRVAKTAVLYPLLLIGWFVASISLPFLVARSIRYRRPQRAVAAALALMEKTESAAHR